jgi:AbrB family looped-hinge helix DNA binding protein
MRRFAMTVTSKGQVTLPAGYRRLVQAEPGDQLEIIVADDGEAKLRKKSGRLADHFGSLAAYGGEPFARHDETTAAIDAAMEEQDARSRR